MQWQKTYSGYYNCVMRLGRPTGLHAEICRIEKYKRRYKLKIMLNGVLLLEFSFNIPRPKVMRIAEKYICLIATKEPGLG